MTERSEKPRIRFAEFSSPWKQHSFADFSFAAGKRNKENLNLKPYAVTNDRGFIPQDEAHDEFGYMKDADITAYNIVPPQSFAYNPARINVGSIGYYNGKESVIVSSLYEVFQTKEYVDDRFLWHWIKSEQLPRWINKLQEGSVRLYFYYDKLCECHLMLPSLEEQKKIASFLDNVDNLIALHQRKCDEVKTLKKAMLQKMFPKEGETVPEIRFSGFTDPWEQRKLSDVMSDFIVPMRDKPKEFGGTIPWTRIEDIEGKYLNDSLSGQYVNEDTVKKMNLKIIPKGSLIVSSSATFGVVAVITQDLITNQTFIGLVPKDPDTVDYWYSYFQSDEARRYMKLQSAGSTIFYIAREHFEKMPIRIPEKKEMIKIGTFLSCLDNAITLHQRKCDELKELKKGLLQQMFV